MAGIRTVETLLERAPDLYDITVFGSEPYGNYNRILLSNVLNRTQRPAEIFINPLEWYERNKVTLHAGVKAVKIDRDRRIVVGKPLDRKAIAYAAGEIGAAGAPPVEAPYDHVIIATGSRPFVPPMEGFGGPGTFLFRTIDDCERIADYARDCKKAAVIGGGLLGLEAARGLLTHGVEVTVLEAAPQLMIAQLDPDAGAILKKTMEGMGVKVLCEKVTTHIVSEGGRVTHLLLKDGSRLETDMVVVSAGIRPITEIATASGTKRTRSSATVMPVTPTQRRPPKRFWMRSISGQVETAMVVAQKMDARNGSRMRRLAAMRKTAPRTLSVIRVRSRSGAAVGVAMTQIVPL
jgi:nitrite reductase (NADH) large subunit